MACLLSFFQQQRLYREQAGTFRPFNIENPLWIFVGGRVVKGLAVQDAVRSKYSCGFPMVETEQPAKPLTGAHLALGLM